MQTDANRPTKRPDQSNSDLDGSVKRGAGKGVVVLGVDDNLHDIVSMTLEHLRAGPFLFPVPQLDEHVICYKIYRRYFDAPNSFIYVYIT